MAVDDQPILEVNFSHRFPNGPRLSIQFRSTARATALFGPSGAGKTTVLNVIAGLLRPDAGRIIVDDEVLFDSTTGASAPMQRRRIGYVFQDHLLFPHLDAAANLRFGMTNPGPKDGISFDHVASALELGDLLARRPAELSWGQRQRVALGRAILSSPRLLLLDEPLEGLDRELRGRTIEFLERILAEFSIPLLFVSHSQAEVRRLAEWIVLVKDGGVAGEGAPADVLVRAPSLELPAPMDLVNLLKVDRLEQRADGTVGWVGDVELSLPAPPAGAPPRYVTVAPSAVTLATTDVRGVSARNQLSGVVATIVDAPGRVLLAVDAGPTLWVEVTKSAVVELGLRVGQPVVCLFKAQSLRYV